VWQASSEPASADFSAAKKDEEKEIE